LDRLFNSANQRKIPIEENDIIGMGEKCTPSNLTIDGFKNLTKKGGHPGYPRNLHGRVAEYCVMHALSTLHGLTKPDHHPKTGGKTPDFVFPYYLGPTRDIEVVTECKGRSKRTNRTVLNYALEKQINAYAMPPGSMKCVHDVDLKNRLIRNYWIGNMPPFKQPRPSSSTTGEPALEHLRKEVRNNPLLTYFLSKWIGKEPDDREEAAFTERKRLELDYPEKKSIYTNFPDDYNCPGIENGLVVGPTPPDLGWCRLDEYRMIKITQEE
jgi:hypothetical protein